MKKVTVATINKALKERGYKVRVANGKGYHYVYSDDTETAELLARKFTTSIYVTHANKMTVDAWIKDVDMILNSENDD